MNDVTASRTTADAPTALRTAGAAAREALDAYAAAGRGGAAPVTGGRGVEVDDVVELLAELRLLQQLRAA